MQIIKSLFALFAVTVLLPLCYQVGNFKQVITWPSLVCDFLNSSTSIEELLSQNNEGCFKFVHDTSTCSSIKGLSEIIMCTWNELELNYFAFIGFLRVGCGQSKAGFKATTEA